MRYTFDFNELRENRKKLLEMYNDPDYTGDKKEISLNIEVYDLFLKLARRKNNDFYDDIDLTMEEESIEALVYDFSTSYNKNIIPIMNLIMPSICVLNELKLGTPYIFGISDNNDDMVKLTLQFFEIMTTPTTYEKVKNLFEENKHFLNINYDKKQNDFPAVTFVDNVLGKKYIALSRVNDVLDYPNLPHELFHYLFADNDTNTLVKHNSYFISEVEGMFANILFGEFWNRYCCEEEKERDLIKNYYLSVFKEEVSELVARNAIVDSLDKNSKVRLHKLNKHIGYYGIREVKDLEGLRPYLTVPQEINIKYSLSYLAALDLYYIYKYDRELAFYLLKCINYFKAEDDIRSLLIRCQITFFEDDYKNLKDYIGLNKTKIKKIGEMRREQIHLELK